MSGENNGGMPLKEKSQISDGIAETTQKLYASHGRRFDQWLSQNAVEPTAEGYVLALQAIAGKLSKKTWRLYRNAIWWWIAEHNRQRATAIKFNMLSDFVDKPPTKKRVLKRHVEPDILWIILLALRRRKRGTMGGRVADLMLAMAATGIRPNEWQSVQIDGRQITVQNAKYHAPSPARPGRGNGPARTLVLDEDMNGTRIEAAIHRTANWMRGKPWARVQSGANRVFRTTVNAEIKSGHLPKEWSVIRIYDCRHQFSADAKANLDMLAGEVAAAMGHRSVITSISHYGKKANGRGRTVIRPSEASISAVGQESRQRARQEVGRTFEKLKEMGKIKNPEEKLDDYLNRVGGPLRNG